MSVPSFSNVMTFVWIHPSKSIGPQKSVAEGIAGVWQGAHLAVGCWGKLRYWWLTSRYVKWCSFSQHEENFGDQYRKQGYVEAELLYIDLCESACVDVGVSKVDFWSSENWGTNPGWSIDVLWWCFWCPESMPFLGWRRGMMGLWRWIFVCFCVDCLLNISQPWG